MNKQILGNLQLVTELGLTIASPIIIAVLVGAYLDKRFGHSGIFTLIFLIFGLSGGFLGAYRLIKKSADLRSCFNSKYKINSRKLARFGGNCLGLGWPGLGLASLMQHNSRELTL